jgi:hypothetical protein
VHPAVGWARWAVAVAALLPAAAAPAPPPEIEILAKSGDPAPGAPPGVVFDSFGTVLADAAGRVAFTGSLAGPGVTTANVNGVWQETSPGVLTLRARAGDPAPDAGPGAVFAGFFQDLTLAGDGRLAFRGWLVGPGVGPDDEGIWATDPAGEPRLVARKGEMAPGTGSSWTALPSEPALGTDGRLAFVAALPGATWGIWALDPAEGLDLVALTGTQAPGAPTDWLFSGFAVPVFDADGSLLIDASMSIPSCYECDYYPGGLWRAPPGGALVPIALAEEPAPGTEAGTTFYSFDDASADASGRVAVEGRVQGPAVHTANEQGIWTFGPTAPLTLLIRSLDPAPGLPEGVLVASPSRPRAARGRVLFRSSLAIGGVASDDALWLASGNGAPPLVLARSGVGLPGLPADVFLEGILWDHSVNEAGRILFGAELTGPGVSGYSLALVEMNASGEVLMLVATGDEIELGEGDVRVLGSAGGALGGTDEVAARLHFAGGSDAVARLTPGPQALPVPGLGRSGLASALVLIAAAGATRLWRGTASPPG